ncbi:VOC family protein [Aeromicrobium duanguangcaii]|uniref:VOC family protein n=1 Tax=Aeromicrobium duanguangcaii TaxID=2968086 RepID=A0ABY5KCK6_9ACTN|nr:VOC family protein [Aeromicrobium duanguangcaii]MCD9152839.1 VOC family protein [Aeromicrobium duanguangcaii]MCL3837158.1 VOC family protein [Aeromicrobium duanguangcaii]UUI67181.1 VOC family protein [Aeromicrobium duanguangcaii]
MARQNVVISLPISDRRTSCDFYERVLDLTAVGEPADDGVPEPLQFSLSETVKLMLIPSGGFGWVTGGRPVAPVAQHECLFTWSATSRSEVDELIERARAAGAEIVSEPAAQPWGYTGTFADPDGHLWAATAEELSEPRG